MNVKVVSSGSPEMHSISCLDWFSGSHTYGSNSRLVICWENGLAQLMYNASDEG